MDYSLLMSHVISVRVVYVIFFKINKHRNRHSGKLFRFLRSANNVMVIGCFLNKHKKSPKPFGFGDKFRNIGCKSALGELGSATGGLQTVLLLLANPKTLVYQGFSASLSEFNP